MLFAGEEVARKRSGGKTNASNGEERGEEEAENEKEKEGDGRKTEKGGEGEHLTGNIYTVYELAGVSNRRGAARRTRGRRESRENERRPSTRK